MSQNRRLPVGAELLSGGGVEFRVWAPLRTRVRVALITSERDGRPPIPLQAEGNGYFSGVVSDARVGARYGFFLDDDERLYPDPASRFQPEGPHGPSQVIDPGAFQWSDSEWPGMSLAGQVIYELHVATFTPEGTWEAAARELPALARLGITLLELLPVADYPGRFGWGYDGVNLFAPCRLYGTPDDFRRFVDRAHELHLGVILDVVYNHFGPDGNFHKAFSPAYFSDRYGNDWGEALNFDGPDAGPVREFFISNAGYWIDEFHLDGLRLDATQQIYDSSPEYVVAAIGSRVRSAARGRNTVVVAENEPQDSRLLRPLAEGGYGLDGLWNDDFHHSARVASTGKREAYFSDYRGTPQELISAVKYGFLMQGQRSAWQKNPRGTSSLDIHPSQFITFLQNHDQVANTFDGRRLHHLTDPGRYRAITAFWLLAPGTPMFFQGQEFAATSNFLYFADHKPDLARAVREGRKKFLLQFPSVAGMSEDWMPPDPAAESTFLRSKLDPLERERNGAAYSLHADLLRLRREDPVIRRQDKGHVDGAVIAPEALVLRFFGEAADDRLLLVNLGVDLDLATMPEPLMAPPVDTQWHMVWSSDSLEYGGAGTPTPVDENGWRITGHSAILLAPRSTKREA